jgi:hypothetical protein
MNRNKLRSQVYPWRHKQILFIKKAEFIKVLISQFSLSFALRNHLKLNKRV